MVSVDRSCFITLVSVGFGLNTVSGFSSPTVTEIESLQEAITSERLACFLALGHIWIIMSVRVTHRHFLMKMSDLMKVLEDNPAIIKHLSAPQSFTQTL